MKSDTIFKYVTAILIAGILSHSAYHWRDFQRDVAVAQRDQFATNIMVLTRNWDTPKQITERNGIMQANGRPDLLRPVPTPEEVVSK